MMMMIMIMIMVMRSSHDHKGANTKISRCDNLKIYLSDTLAGTLLWDTLSSSCEADGKPVRDCMIPDFV